MTTKILFSLIILFSLPVLTFSQGKKTIKSKQLESKTVHEYFVKEGQKESVIEMIEIFDTEGNVTELKEFNSDGEIKNWKIYKYDEDKNKIEELTFNAKGKVMERIVWIYNDGLVVEKQYYDHKGRLTKRKEYTYEYRLD